MNNIVATLQYYPKAVYSALRQTPALTGLIKTLKNPPRTLYAETWKILVSSFVPVPERIHC